MERQMKPPLPQQLLSIAQTHINGNMRTLQSRYLDQLDFYEVSVWNIVAALTAAYELGWKAGAGEEEA